MIKDDHFGRMELFMSLLEMNGICKSFNGIQVLKEVSLRVEAGEVHALLGENGAGKSTLMNILTGVHDKDAGTVVFDGKEMKNISVKSSENAGIAFVHQELNLFNDLKVYENIFLCREYTNKFGKVDTKRMIKESRELFEELGVEIDPEIEVSGLTTSQKQLLEISKALFFKAKLLILDEPTSSLDDGEVEKLFNLMRRLKSEGVGIIFVTHFLEQVYAVCDKITVLRNGQLVGQFTTAELPRVQLVAKMMGKDFDDLAAIKDSKREEKHGEEDIVIKAVGLGKKGYIKPFDLVIHKGEVVGFTGLLGSGRSETVRVLYGAEKPDEGELSVKGRPIAARHPLTSMNAGMAYLPEDRKEEGLFLEQSIASNIISGNMNSA